MSETDLEKANEVIIKIPRKISKNISSKGILVPEFLEFVISSMPMDNWVDLFLASRRVNWSDDSTSNEKSSGLFHKEEAFSLGHSGIPITYKWTETEMRRYLSVVSADKEMEKGFFLLEAYIEVGPNPTSSDLKKICGFDNDRIWYQELRVTKSKLSLQARKMNLPPLFYRPQTTNGSRFHPLDPNAFVELKQFISEYPNSENSPSNWGKMNKTKDEEGTKGDDDDIE